MEGLFSQSWRSEFCSSNFLFPSSKRSRCMKLIKSLADLNRNNASLASVHTSEPLAVQLPYIYKRNGGGKSTWVNRHHHTFYFTAHLYLGTYLRIPFTSLVKIVYRHCETPSSWVLPLYSDVGQLFPHEVGVHRFASRLQVGVLTLSGVQNEDFLAAARRELSGLQRRL